MIASSNNSFCLYTLKILSSNELPNGALLSNPSDKLKCTMCFASTAISLFLSMPNLVELLCVPVLPTIPLTPPVR